MTPLQVSTNCSKAHAVKTLILSQMAIPRGVALDYAGAGIELLKMMAGVKPELARGGSHTIAQVWHRGYVHSGGQIRAVHHVDKNPRRRRRAWVCVARRERVEGALSGVSNSDPYSTLIEMVGEDICRELLPSA